MTDGSDNPTPLGQIIDLRLFAIWPLVAAVHVVGNFTGHYQGLYAQSDIALYAQGVMIVLLLAAMMVLVPSVQRHAEEEFDD